MRGRAYSQLLVDDVPRPRIGVVEVMNGIRDLARDASYHPRAARETGGSTPYYEHWLAAVESLLAKRGLLTRSDFLARAHEYSAGVRDEPPQ